MSTTQATGEAIGDHRKVLQFTLDGTQYCVDIDDVAEILTRDDDLTSLPNTPAHVEGVMDLRGETTTIVDPRTALDLADATEPAYVIVFESDDTATGWLVEDVERVRSVPEEPDDTSHASGAVRGVYELDGEFVIQVVPDELT